MADEKEDAVDVEEVDVEIVKKGEAVKPTSKPEELRRRKGIPPRKKSNTKLMIVGIVVIVVVVAGIGIALMSTVSGPLDLLIVGYSDDYMDIIVHAPAGMGMSNSGDATIRIEHEKTTVYTGTAHITDNVAKPRIYYKDFIVANGDYDIYATFKGTTVKETTKSLEFAPNEMDAFMYESDAKPENPTVQLIIEVSFWLNGSTRMPIESTGRLSYTVYHEGAQFATGLRELKDNTSNTIAISQTSGGPRVVSGNYSICLNFTNSLMKDGIPQKTLSASTSGYYNKAPYPILRVKNSEYTIGTSVTIKSGESLNMSATPSEDFDGEIVSYVWDFDVQTDSNGDGNTTNDVDATTQSTSHVYVITEPIVLEQTYQATITLTDNQGAKTVAGIIITVQRY